MAGEVLMSTEWPSFTVSRDVPDWLQMGKTQFHNQHAGPAEVAKGVLTFFTVIGHSFEEMMERDHDLGGNITPDTVWDWTNKYTDEYLDWFQDVGKDFVMVTWSCGFSDNSEKLQRKIVSEFTARAHQRGIRICAYLSLTNMFWKDVLKHEPELMKGVARYTNGKPHLYGYSQARYLSCINQPVWLDYLKRKVRLAIEEADVDAIYFDNLSGDCACETCQQLFRDFTETHGGRRYDLPLVKQVLPKGPKRDGEMETDLAMEESREVLGEEEEKCRKYLYHRFTSWRVAEALRDIRDYAFSLKSPLVFSSNNHMKPFINDVCNLVYSQDPQPPDPAKNSIPILRYLAADGDGWKAVTANGWKRCPDNDGCPEERLCLAEGMACQIFPYGLAHKAYNQFYRGHPELFADVEPVAKVGVIMEFPGVMREVLNPLGFENILYDVIVYDKWSKEQLGKYEVILLPNLEMVSDELLAALREFEENGGTLITTGRSMAHDGYGRKRDNPPEVTCEEFDYEQPIGPEVIGRIRKASNPQLVAVDAPPHVVVSLARRTDGSAYVLHVLNYDNREPTGPVKVTVKVPDRAFKTATLVSPDEGVESGATQRLDAGQLVAIDKLDTYALVLLE